MIITINWEAISAISQILATVATVIAIYVSLRIARMPITSKAKIIIGRPGRFLDINHFVFLNIGHSKIKTKSHGLMLVRSIWPSNKKNVVVMARHEPFELEPSTDYVFKITNEAISSRLKSICDCKPGKNVKLIVFFLDTKNKRFEKRFRFKVD